MMACSRRWLRLVRVLVACLAFFFAQAPSSGSAATASSVDGIALVMRATRATVATGEATAGPRRAERGRAAALESVHAVPFEELVLLGERETRAYDAATSRRVLVPHKYLRHRSLLC